jgi:hypothetical protein
LFDAEDAVVVDSIVIQCQRYLGYYDKNHAQPLKVLRDKVVAHSDPVAELVTATWLNCEVVSASVAMMLETIGNDLVDKSHYDIRTTSSYRHREGAEPARQLGSLLAKAAVIPSMLQDTVPFAPVGDVRVGSGAKDS